jgi:hypothetical protein
VKSSAAGPDTLIDEMLTFVEEEFVSVMDCPTVLD